ncbi:hypothetical protein P154DRAFT_43885 [Amniculicola lignicola CBS 123094]|uniref:S-adenosyl-L-methionine-dependent methyltransferase n=1 Tax=Amniculicola lignicola CBS 123094 TaxID=1392246 RepID=A0A6A5WRY6_9PLEO|nr:hypothetical protein P154DRAFT_43885 [Amniculicola lignicola CBS 123094]
MEEEPPHPDGSVRDHTAAQHKRPRTDSGSSTSAESLKSTRTLQSEDVEFVHENGRVYGNLTNFTPCDQAEQDRLAIQHQVFVLALKGNLATTRITPFTKRILDLGTGPGNWAVAIAQKHPQVEVVGLDMAVWDLETTEAEAGQARVTWELDNLDIWGDERDGDKVDDLTSRLHHYDPFRDPTARIPTNPRGEGSSAHSPTPSTTAFSFDPYKLEQEQSPGWNFTQPFDLIHLRNLKGTFASWEPVYAEIYKNLSPGGHVEIADYELVLPEAINLTQSGIESISSSAQASERDFPSETMRKLYMSMMQASFKSGRPFGTYYMHPSYLSDAGFKDIKTTYVNVPVGQWHSDPEQQRIGKMFLVVVMEGLEPQTLRLLTKWGDAEKVWTAEEVRQTIEIVKEELLHYNKEVERRREAGIKSVDDDESQGWSASFKWVTGRKSKNA